MHVLLWDVLNLNSYLIVVVTDVCHSEQQPHRIWSSAVAQAYETWACCVDCPVH